MVNNATQTTQAEAAFSSGAIPGMSLTVPPGTTASERPPRFVDLDEAAMHIWNNLKKPQASASLMAAFKQGAPIEMMTQNVLMEGFRTGEIGFDLKMLLQPIVAYQMAALASIHGVEAKPAFDRNDVAKNIAQMELDSEREREQAQAKDFTTGFTGQELVEGDIAAAEESQREFEGIMAADPFGADRTSSVSRDELAELQALEDVSERTAASMPQDEIDQIEGASRVAEDENELAKAEAALVLDEALGRGE